MIRGLPLAELAAIFAAVGIGVAVLYVLKLRRRVVAVPFSPLWERILRDKDATTLFSRLKRLLSLLLQLVLLALLVLALGDPRAAESLVKGRNVVVLVDASASMQATDVAPSRLGVAKDEVGKMIRGLGGADRMLIAQMDAVVTPLGPMTGDTSALEREVDSIAATDARADFPRALRFATDVLRGADRAEIVVVSDGALGAADDAAGAVHLGDAKLSYVRVGKRGKNVGITEFSVRRYPLDRSRYEVMLELTNSSPDVEDVELQLLGDGALVDLTKLRLQPGERLPRFYPQLSGANRTLEAKIARVDGTHDDLPVDDHEYALLPERRRARRSSSSLRATRTSRPRCCSTNTSTSPTWLHRAMRRPWRRAAGTRSSSTASRRPRCRRPTPSTSIREAPAVRCASRRRSRRRASTRWIESTRPCAFSRSTT